MLISLVFMISFIMNLISEIHRNYEKNKYHVTI